MVKKGGKRWVVTGTGTHVVCFDTVSNRQRNINVSKNPKIGLLEMYIAHYSVKQK